MQDAVSGGGDFSQHGDPKMVNTVYCSIYKFCIYLAATGFSLTVRPPARNRHCVASYPRRDRAQLQQYLPMAYSLQSCLPLGSACVQTIMVQAFHFFSKTYHETTNRTAQSPQ